ncbi:LacI family transcriptional regulator [Paenibacillus sp. SYP-B3998]|uniref:LacI family transcriptional regulator n=1 Tax=Paenibacillus sp. SYP-B3998 TaxID=2678564 RepID=A0A6G4A365_9BACL|nr:LacI family DNA-binding transcriptional regulator [Paenibacillus sp. SYP-B3998]NEW08936.1 LacI family transcriptional regulator [Paenibacillus sp. SYP-B3998]
MNEKTSMQDIADKLNISKNAVSLALNNKSGVSEQLRSRVLEAASQLNYRTEVRAKKKRSNLLVLMPEHIHDDKFFYYEVCWSTEKRAKENGYNAIICSVAKDMENNLVLPEIYNEMLFKGVLLIGAFQLDYVSKLFESQLPLVTVDHYYHDLRLDAVITANAEEAHTIVNYLIKKGHQHIGFIGASPNNQNFRDRWYGYQNAMSAAGLNVDRNHCFFPSSSPEAHSTISTELTVHLKGMPSQPTAFFCVNDRMAILTIQLLSSEGIKVPDDISIVGFDDIEAASMISPQLTTIQVNREHLGFEAVDYLIRKIDYGGSPAKISIYGNLIERDSCTVTL